MCDVSKTRCDMAIERARRARSCFRYASAWIARVSRSIFFASSSIFSMRAYSSLFWSRSEFRLSMVLSSFAFALPAVVSSCLPNHEKKAVSTVPSSAPMMPYSASGVLSGGRFVFCSPPYASSRLMACAIVSAKASRAVPLGLISAPVVSMTVTPFCPQKPGSLSQPSPPKYSG